MTGPCQGAADCQLAEMLDLPGPFLDKINPHLPRVHTSRAGRETLAPDAPAADVQRYLSSRINSQVTLGSKGLIRSNWGGTALGTVMGKQQGGLQEWKLSVEAGDFLYVHAMAGPQTTQVWEPGPAAAHGAQHRLQELCKNTCKKSWGKNLFP